MMLVSAVYGPGIWERTFVQQFPSLFRNTLLQDTAIIHASIAFFFAIFLLVYMPTCLLGVYRVCRRKRVSFRMALLQILPMAMASLASVLWLWSPYSQIRHTHFSLFVLTFGVGFGKMATKIIYAHLTKRRFPYHSGLMLPLFLGSFLVNVPLMVPSTARLVTLQAEIAYLWAWFIIAVIGYLNWSHHIIRSFCSYLDIHCFTIKKRTPPT